MKEVFHLVYYPWRPRVICIKILSCQLLAASTLDPPKKGQRVAAVGIITIQTTIRFSCNVLELEPCVLQSHYPSKTWLKHKNFHQSLWRMRARNPTVPKKQTNANLTPPHQIKTHTPIGETPKVVYPQKHPQGAKPWSNHTLWSLSATCGNEWWEKWETSLLGVSGIYCCWEVCDIYSSMR